MKIIKALKFILIILCCTLFFPTTLVSANQEIKQQLDSYIKSYLDEYQVPGASIAIIHNNEVFYSKSWGVTGGTEEQVTSKTPFTIGSISKSLTGLAIMKLIDKKVIALDDPVQMYLPWFELKDEQAASQITIKHLLTHSSGFSTYSGLLLSDQESKKTDSIKKNVESLLNISLSTLPGERYQYSNANFLVLGALIEEVTNQTFSDFMEQNVFTPLGMNNSAADYNKAYEKGYVSGYQSWFGIPLKSSVTYDNGGAPYGYITASVEDLIQYIRFLSNTDFNDYLNEQTMNKYLTPQIQTGDNRYYGLGIRISYPDSQDEMIWHSGSTPDSHAELFYMQKTGWGGVMLTNKNNQLEEEGLYYLKIGIINILNGDEPVNIPKNTPVIQLITLGLVSLLIFLFTYLLLKLKSRNIRKNGAWVLLGIFCMILSIVLVPLFIKLVGAPWHAIKVFSPDIAFLVIITVALLALNGILAVSVSFKNAKES